MPKANNLFEHVTNNIVPNAGVIDRAKDLGIDAIKAAVGLPESIVGLADIPTGGAIGKWIEENTPVQFEETQNILSDLYSEERKAEQRDVSAAFDESFLGGMKEAISQPAVPIGTIVQSLPQMMGGRAVAGGALKLAPKMSQALAAGLGEGMFSAGSTAEGIRYENESRDLTAGQSATALGSGALTGVLGGISNKIGAKFGLEDIDVASKVTKETIKKSAKKSLVKSILGGIITEGLLEELPQSTQEAIAMNLATGKEWDEGLAEAAGMGIISGGVMGGGINAKTTLGARLAMVKIRALEQLQEDLKKKDEAEVAEGNQEKSLTSDTAAPREALSEAENDVILDDVDNVIPFGAETDEEYIPYDDEEDYEYEEYDEANDQIHQSVLGEREDKSDLDLYQRDKEDFTAENVTVEPFVPEGYDPARGINSDDIQNIRKVETGSHAKLDEAIKNGKTKAIKKNGVYFVRGNQTKSIASNIGGAIAVNLDKSKSFFTKPDKSLLGKNTSRAIESFGMTPMEFKSLFKDLKSFNKFLVDHEKAHTFYKDEASSVDGERRATYSVLNKSQRKKLIKTIEKKIKKVHANMNSALDYHNKHQRHDSSKAYQDHYQQLEMLLDQLTNIYEAEKIPEELQAEVNTPALYRRLAEETAKSHMNRVLKHAPEVSTYKKSGKESTKELRKAERKYLMRKDIDEESQLAFYKQNYEDLIKEDRANSQYTAPDVGEEISGKEFEAEQEHPQEDLDKGMAAKTKTKQSSRDIINNGLEDEDAAAIELQKFSKIRENEDSPLGKHRNKAALREAFEEMGESELLAAETNEKLPNSKYNVGYRGMIMTDLEWLSNFFVVDDMIDFIKKQEGNIHSLAQLDGHPQALDDLIGYATYLATKDDPEINDADEFVEEHEASLKALEEAETHDLIANEEEQRKADLEKIGKGNKLKVKVKRKRIKPAVTGKSKTVEVVEKGETKKKKIRKSESIVVSDDTVNVTPVRKKPIKKKKTRVDTVEMTEQQKRNALDLERRRMRNFNETKERQRKQRLLKQVEQEIQDNSLVSELIGPFFDYITDIKNSGKYKTAAIMNFVGVSKYVRSKNKKLAALYKKDPVKADAIVRKLIYSINSLHDSLFNAYKNKQAEDFDDMAGMSIMKRIATRVKGNGDSSDRLVFLNRLTPKLRAQDFEVEEIYPEFDKAFGDELKEIVGSMDGSYRTSQGYLNHSGGAKGADSIWENTGSRYGVKTNAYRADKPKKNTHKQITEEEYKEGIEVYELARKMLDRKRTSDKYILGLMARNWQQVKNADAIYAVGDIEGGYAKGGTGYAIAMAAMANKPVYFFDQKTKGSCKHPNAQRELCWNWY